MRGVLFLIALGSAGMFALLLPAILIALAGNEGDMFVSMSIFAFLSLFLALVILLAISGNKGSSERSFRFLALVVTWCVLSLLAAASFMVLADIGFFPALFEAVSALTTSGGSVLIKDTAPKSLLFWRALLEWYGGFLTLVSIVLVLAPAGFGGLQSQQGGILFKTPEAGLFSISSYGSLLLQYGLVTLLVLLGLMVFGVRPLEAVMLGMVSTATGGFVPFSDPIEIHIGEGAMTILALGLCVGAMSVFWRRALLHRPRHIVQNSLEAKILILLIVFLAIVYAARIASVQGNAVPGNLVNSLEEGFFAAASLVATSGMESRPGILALLPDILVLAVIFVGGGVYSTSGGVKIFRIGAMWTYAVAELNRLIYPNSVERMKFGEASIEISSINAIWSYFIIAVVIIGSGSVLVALSGLSFEASIVFVVSLFSNAGPVYEALRPVAADPSGDWPVYAALPSGITYFLATLVMFIGRLEVLVVLAVFNIRYWYNR